MRIDPDLIRVIERDVSDPDTRQRALATARSIVTELDDMDMVNDVEKLVLRWDEVDDLAIGVDPGEIPLFFEVLRGITELRPYFKEHNKQEEEEEEEEEEEKKEQYVEDDSDNDLDEEAYPSVRSLLKETVAMSNRAASISFLSSAVCVGCMLFTVYVVEAMVRDR